MFDSVWPHELQHARLLCLLLSLGVCSNSCPFHQWCHLSDGGKGTLVHVGENINFHSCNGKYYGHSSNKNRTLYVIKIFCFWITTGRKLNQYLEEISALPWSLKHYSQHPRCGNNLSVCWWMNGHVHYQTQKYRYCIISFMCRIWSQNQKQQRRVVVMGWGLGQMGKCWSKGINFQL